MSRQCEGVTKKNAPCEANPLKPGTVIKGVTVSGRWCRQHDKDLPDSARIGGAQPGAGRPKNPRVVDVLRERIEKNIDEVLNPLFEALKADSTVVVGQGSDAYPIEVPDHRTRIVAVKEILDRGHGRSRQTVEVSDPDGNALGAGIIMNAELAQEARALLRRAAAAGSGEPGGSSSGDE